MQRTSKSQIRRRILTRTAAITASFSLSWAAGAQSAEECVAPFVTKRQFEAMVRDVVVDDSMRLVLETTYQVYAEGMEAMRQSAEQEAEKAGLLHLRAVIDGRWDAEPHEVRAWELAVREAFAQTWPAADELLANFELDLTISVDSSQAASIRQRLPALHRELFLHARQAVPGTVEPRVALGDNVDLIRIFRHESRPGGPLQLYGGNVGAVPDLTEQIRASGLQVQTVLSEYESQLDSILMKSFPGDRAGALKRMQAETKGDAAAMRELDQAAFERWHALYMLNRQTADRVTSVLAATDARAAKAWSDAVDSTTAPWLFVPEPADEAAAWIADREDISAETKAEARSMSEQFLARRTELRRTMLEFIVHQRVQLRAMIHPTGKTGAQLRRDDADIRRAQVAIDARVHELIALEATTRVKLVRLLGDERSAEMLKAISSTKRGRK